MALIEVRGLKKLYRMGDSVVHALDGVDLTIERGDFVAITGASGSGKSTMMHLLGCLDRPNAGTYVLNGRNVSDLSDRELAAVRNKQIGFVFQTFNLINRTTALENVGVPLFYARQTNTRGPARRALERVGLATRSHHNPNELSGGERQRVAIARAIVNDPPLLLADEPTGNLDSRTGEQIMAIFRDLNAQGVTIVIVTHEPDIARLARRIVLMRDGKIVSDRLTAEIAAEEGQSRPRKWTATDVTEAQSIAAPLAAETPVLASPMPMQPHEPAAGAYTYVPAELTARLMRGATPGFACGLLALIQWGLVTAAQAFLSRNYDLVAISTSGKPPPMPVIVISAAMLLFVLGAVVLGALAIVFSNGARRRMRQEPGNWLGRKRTWAGLIMGLVAVLFPVVGVAITIVKKLT